MILPIKYINGKSPKQSSSGRFFMALFPIKVDMGDLGKREKPF